MRGGSSHVLAGQHAVLAPGLVTRELHQHLHCEVGALLFSGRILAQDRVVVVVGFHSSRRKLAARLEAGERRRRGEASGGAHGVAEEALGALVRWDVGVPKRRSLHFII